MIEDDTTHRDTNMARHDELALLEAERDRLLSMIAYHNGPFYGMSWDSRAPAWFVAVGIAITCGIAGLLVAGVFAGQISPLTIILLVVGLPLLAYILSRRVTLFGVTFFVGDILAQYPVGEPPGEQQARQRLAECEAQIMKLKESRS
jgi:hypothetical protein